MAKRYIIIVGAVLLAILVDAIIFMGLLGVAYGRVPTLYHAGNILMLSCAFAVIGDMVFKGEVLR